MWSVYKKAEKDLLWLYEQGHASVVHLAKDQWGTLITGPTCAEKA